MLFAWFRMIRKHSTPHFTYFRGKKLHFVNYLLFAGKLIFILAVTFDGIPSSNERNQQPWEEGIPYELRCWPLYWPEHSSCCVLQQPLAKMIPAKNLWSSPAKRKIPAILIKKPGKPCPGSSSPLSNPRNEGKFLPRLVTFYYNWSYNLKFRVFDRIFDLFPAVYDWTRIQRMCKNVRR